MSLRPEQSVELPCPYLGKPVELNGERCAHILDQHPDLPVPLQDLLAEVLVRPDQIRRSSRSPQALLFSRWYHGIRQGKHVVAVVVRDDVEPPRHWVITAYLARRLSGGTLLWQPPN